MRESLLADRVRPVRFIIAAALLLLLAEAEARPGWKSSKDAQRQSAQLKPMLNSNDDQSLRTVFRQWKASWKKSFQADEEDARFQNFKSNLKSIVQHNLNPRKKWWAAPNKFSALSWDEFVDTHLGLDATKLKAHGAAASSRPSRTRKQLQTAPPAAVDWTSMTTPIRNQGECGSCWAFAVIGAIEAKFKMAGEELNLSVQQLVDCDSSNNGCDGGWPTDAFGYVYSNSYKGVTSNQSYPYTGTGNGMSCDASKIQQPTYRPSVSPGYTFVPAQSETEMMKAVAAQPTVIALFVESSFQSYAGGIYSPSSCTNNTVNHAVVAVGYDSGAGHWKIRNSWGSEWGESGHIRMAMSGDGPGLCAMYLEGGWTPTDVLSSPSPRPSAKQASPQPSASQSPMPRPAAQSPSPSP